jgi:hypothetical protein
MGMKKSEKEIVARQRELGEVTSKALQDYKASGGFQRFAPSKLQILRPELKDSTSFLDGAPSPFAASLAYQALPGMTYANRPGTTTPFYPQTNVAPAAPPPPSGGSFERSEPAIDRGRISDPLDLETENAILLAELVDQANEMNFERRDDMRDAFKDFELDQAIRRGPFQIEDYDDILGDDNLLVSGGMPRGILSLSDLRDIQGSIGDNVMMTMADGGIASLPVQMSAGGTLAAPGQTLGGTPAGGLMSLDMGGVGGVGVGMNPTMPTPADKPAEKKASSKKQSPYANMTREQLIALLEKNEKVDVGDELTRLGQALMPQILADGGEAFPRMNGPISGPGTETSDDIPAMLSDGEFVVNAKAVRGVGKLSGAGKSKAEQRREGARMMYALQKAGEQAMRKA